MWECVCVRRRVQRTKNERQPTIEACGFESKCAAYGLNAIAIYLYTKSTKRANLPPAQRHNGGMRVIVRTLYNILCWIQSRSTQPIRKITSTEKRKKKKKKKQREQWRQCVFPQIPEIKSWKNCSTSGVGFISFKFMEMSSVQHPYSFLKCWGRLPFSMLDGATFVLLCVCVCLATGSQMATNHIQSSCSVSESIRHTSLPIFFRPKFISPRGDDKWAYVSPNFVDNCSSCNRWKMALTAEFRDLQRRIDGFLWNTWY